MTFHGATNSFLLVLPIIPPLLFDERLIVCSRHMSLSTAENGTGDRLTTNFPSMKPQGKSFATFSCFISFLCPESLGKDTKFITLDYQVLSKLQLVQRRGPFLAAILNFTITKYGDDQIHGCIRFLENLGGQSGSRAERVKFKMASKMAAIS